MRILFDNGTPRGIARFLKGHTIHEARAFGWDSLQNGELLATAEAAGFDLLITTDKNIRYQQNLKSRSIGIVVLGRGRWKLMLPMMTRIASAVDAAQRGSYTEVEIPER